MTRSFPTPRLRSLVLLSVLTLLAPSALAETKRHVFPSGAAHRAGGHSAEAHAATKLPAKKAIADKNTSGHAEPSKKSTDKVPLVRAEAATKAPDKSTSTHIEPKLKGAEKTNPVAKPTAEAAELKAAAQPAPASKPAGPKAGFLILAGTAGSWSGYAILKGDVISPRAKTGIRRVLASWRTGKQMDVPDRLIRLLVSVSNKFGGRSIRIVGGYREHSFARASRHTLGHAVDFSVDGVTNVALRDYLLTFPSLGVGFYPNSSFVHADVRQTRAYWVDQARPGEPPNYAYAGASKPAVAPPARKAPDMAPETAPEPAPTLPPVPVASL
ncbi:MAG TPA: DUF882 domain-containing protein [Polyangiaceae bacterium]|jgi:uncharacterized protein YcbK (DUF882 family)|nr:DUF882 domain-containing protein [Polyangiaceae bacterium]